MIVDSEEQRRIILNALLSAPIQGDYVGISQEMPKITAIIEAVRSAKVEESDGGKPE